nr:class I SAM-dependent methyltransferase [uncultured Roseococcus sp.]
MRGKFNVSATDIAKSYVIEDHNKINSAPVQFDGRLPQVDLKYRELINNSISDYERISGQIINSIYPQIDPTLSIRRALSENISAIAPDLECQTLPKGAFPTAMHFNDLKCDWPPIEAAFQMFHPKSVLDIGCGLGAYLKLLEEKGAQITGVDGAEWTNQHLISREQYQCWDLSSGTPTTLMSQFDVSICLETLEHIPEEAAFEIIRKLSTCSKQGIIFSAAQIGQPGHHHINCHPHRYWLDAFDKLGWVVDVHGSARLRLLSTLIWFQRNLFVFRPASHCSVDPHQLERLLALGEHHHADWPTHEEGRTIVGFAGQHPSFRHADNARVAPAPIYELPASMSKLRAAVVKSDALVEELEIKLSESQARLAELELSMTTENGEMSKPIDQASGATENSEVIFNVGENSGKNGKLVYDLEEEILHPKILDAFGNAGPAKFGRLAQERLPEPLASGNFTPVQMTGLIDLLCTPMATPVPSAWVQHGPIMMALMALLRPRRYAELGSHHGFSFFAACQGAAEIRSDTECVAIDTWRGDHHAGNYGEEVYENFLKGLRRDHNGPYFHIRALFDDAADCFEEGSLDLLLIDGLHTLKAVEHDFQIWLPKMSSRGVMLFHDTTVYDHDFGVWQFWDLISKKYPSFNFLHGHGLGIIYVGTPEAVLGTLLGKLAEDADLTHGVRGLLRGIGSMSAMTSDMRLQLDRRAEDAEKAHAEILTAHAEILNARADAGSARDEADSARTEVERVHAEIQSARAESAIALSSADTARAQSAGALSLAETARAEAVSAQLAAVESARREAESAQEAQRARAEADRAWAEVERAHAEVVAIRQSSSWRVTRPMRAFARQAKRLFR